MSRQSSAPAQTLSSKMILSTNSKKAEEQSSYTLKQLQDGIDVLANEAYENQAKSEIEIVLRNNEGEVHKVITTLCGRTIDELPHPHLRLYKFKCHGDSYAVFVSRGTHIAEDIWTDFQLASLNGSVPARFLQSVEYVRGLMKTDEGLKNCRILFAGHSLGAAEAEYLAVCFDKESIAFDNPGCKNIIQKSLKHKTLVKSRHLTVNGAPNIINRASTWFTGGPVGIIEFGNKPLFDLLDALLIVLMLVFLLLIVVSHGVTGAGYVVGGLAVLVFAVICWISLQHHSMADRNRIVHYSENAPAGGHLILFVALMIMLGLWLIFKGCECLFKTVKKLFSRDV